MEITMKTVVHSENAKDKLLHIEADGCIINVRVGVNSDDGHKKTIVEIKCDQYAGEQGWFINENGESVKYLNIAVQQETEQEYENRRTYERMLEHPIAKMRICDVLDQMNSDAFALLHYRINEGAHKGNYVVEIERMKGYKQEPDTYHAYSVPVMLGTDFSTPQTMGDVITHYHATLKHWHGEILAYHWVAQEFEKRYLPDES